MFSWSVSSSIFIRLKRRHDSGILQHESLWVLLLQFGIGLPSPFFTQNIPFASLLYWCSSFCVLPFLLRFCCSCFWVAGMSCFHVCSSPWCWTPASNFLSSFLPSLSAFFLPCLPGISDPMLSYGSPALCEVVRASLLLLELSLRCTRREIYLEQPWPRAPEELASLILIWVSGKRENSVMIQTWQNSSA